MNKFTSVNRYFLLTEFFFSLLDLPSAFLRNMKPATLVTVQNVKQNSRADIPVCRFTFDNKTVTDKNVCPTNFENPTS